MREADERRRASAITTISIRLSLVGAQVGCRMKTSLPRTFSFSSTLTSPSLKRPTVASPRGMCSSRTTRRARSGLAFPVNTIILDTQHYLFWVVVFAIMDSRLECRKHQPVRRGSLCLDCCRRENGRGGWIRTNAWQDQNLLPYRLATPL